MALLYAWVAKWLRLYRSITPKCVIIRASTRRLWRNHVMSCGIRRIRSAHTMDQLPVSQSFCWTVDRQPCPVFSLTNPSGLLLLFVYLMQFLLLCRVSSSDLGSDHVRNVFFSISDSMLILHNTHLFDFSNSNKSQNYAIWKYIMPSSQTSFIQSQQTHQTEIQPNQTKRIRRWLLVRVK